ncbi:MAG: ATP phosphoribosyltransferase regulatory subunit [Bacillota bacterium]|nr:ATP phosphoribosyltransferase regulatory subunit [Bacillota bacterium]
MSIGGYTTGWGSSNGSGGGAAFGTPRGTRDLLPAEAALRHAVEERVRRVFTAFGYREVRTPVFEREAVVAQGAAPGQQANVFRFFSPDGEVLALRSDLTTPIARLVTQRLSGERRPLRLFYVADVFRWAEPGGGRQRQFGQAGVELVGAGGPAADAEVVLLAIRALEAAGVADFRLDLGQVAFFTGLLAESGLGRAEQEAVHEAFLAKDWVGLEATLARVCPEPERRRRIFALTDLRGGREVLDRAAELVELEEGEARRALENLASVWSILEGFGVAGRLAIDLGLVKDLAYYTGLVVEGYVPRLGYTLCTGGRYDGLYAQFGAAEPATGFALGLERVTEALARQDEAGGAAGGREEGFASTPAPGDEAWVAWVAERLADPAGKGR